jgi:hypothetical protein
MTLKVVRKNLEVLDLLQFKGLIPSAAFSDGFNN